MLPHTNLPLCDFIESYIPPEVDMYYYEVQLTSAINYIVCLTRASC